MKKKSKQSKKEQEKEIIPLKAGLSNLNAAMDFCIENGQIPIHKDGINGLLQYIKYCTTATEELIKLKSVFQSRVIGIELNANDAKLYLEAITLIEKQYSDLKEPYDRAIKALENLLAKAK